MFKEMFRYNKKDFKKFIYLHVILFVLVLAIYSALFYCSYKGGVLASQVNNYFAIRFWLMMFTQLFFVICFIFYIVSIFLIGIKYILPSAVLLAIFFFAISLSSEPLVSPVANGYYKYVKENVDINEIHDWLVHYENPEYDFVHEDGIKQVRVFDNDLPESIKSLNPSRGMVIFENEGKKYIRISHGVDWELSVGLCVMEEPMDVPEWGDNFKEKRIKLSDTAFVWAGD